MNLVPHPSAAERELLLRGCMADAPVEGESSLPGEEVDWERLTQVASAQGVLPLLVHRVQGWAPPGHPSGVPAGVEGEARFQTAHTLRMMALLLRVLTTLRDAGIVALPFKGPALGALLYGDPGIRPCSDLDLLVRPDDVPAALDALEAVGMRCPRHSPGRERLLLRHGHARPLLDEDGSVVELHWRITSPMHPIRLPASRLLARSESISIAGHPLLVPHPSDLFAMLAVHGAKHAWQRLIWISDMARLILRIEEGGWGDPEQVWSALLADAGSGGHLRIALWGGAMGGTLLHRPLPAPLLRRMGGDDALPGLVERALEVLFAPPLTGGEAASVYLRAWPGWFPRARMVLRSLLSPGPEDWEGSGVPDPLLWTLRATRPFRVVRRHILSSGTEEER